MVPKDLSKHKKSTLQSNKIMFTRKAEEFKEANWGCRQVKQLKIHMCSEIRNQRSKQTFQDNCDMYIIGRQWSHMLQVLVGVDLAAKAKRRNSPFDLCNGWYWSWRCKNQYVTWGWGLMWSRWGKDWQTITKVQEVIGAEYEGSRRWSFCRCPVVALSDVFGLLREFTQPVRLASCSF